MHNLGDKDPVRDSNPVHLSFEPQPIRMSHRGRHTVLEGQGIYNKILPCKAKRQYLITFQVSRYCPLALLSSIQRWSGRIPVCNRTCRESRTRGEVLRIIPRWDRDLACCEELCSPVGLSVVSHLGWDTTFSPTGLGTVYLPRGVK